MAGTAIKRHAVNGCPAQNDVNIQTSFDHGLRDECRPFYVADAQKVLNIEKDPFHSLGLNQRNIRLQQAHFTIF